MAEGSSRRDLPTAVGTPNDDHSRDHQSAIVSRRTFEQIDQDEWDDIYVVGDVHGCIAELEQLLDRLAPSSDDLVLFVGDLVGKGPDSPAVLDLVQDQHNLRSVRGNNEQKLLDGTCGEWITSDQREYLRSLPLGLWWDEHLVVHGGIDPRVPIESQDAESLLTMRSIPPGNGYCGPFWFESYEGTPRVFFGHTVLDEPFIGEHAVGLDTGCVYGGALSAYDCRHDEVLTVPAARSYQPRTAAKIGCPG